MSRPACWRRASIPDRWQCRPQAALRQPSWACGLLIADAPSRVDRTMAPDSVLAIRHAALSAPRRPHAGCHARVNDVSPSRYLASIEALEGGPQSGKHVDACCCRRRPHHHRSRLRSLRAADRPAGQGARSRRRNAGAGKRQRTLDRLQPRRARRRRAGVPGRPSTRRAGRADHGPDPTRPAHPGHGHRAGRWTERHRLDLRRVDRGAIGQERRAAASRSSAASPRTKSATCCSAPTATRRGASCARPGT